MDERRPEIGSRDVAWRIGDLPTLHGDRAMLKLVVANALKFTRTRERAQAIVQLLLTACSE